MNTESSAGEALEVKPTIVRVRDCMNTRFDVVDGMMTIHEVLSSLQHRENKAVIVAKRHEDDELGMLLLSEVGRKVLAENRSPERVNVYEIMSKPVVTVSPEMDYRYCARLFERYKLSRAPVVENGQVIGLVSFTQLVMRGMIR